MSDLFVRPSVRSACRLEIQRKMAQAQQNYSSNHEFTKLKIYTHHSRFLQPTRSECMFLT